MTEDPFKFACFYYSKRRLKADIWIYSLPCYELKRNKIKERIEKIKNEIYMSTAETSFLIFKFI